jgi:hypothetical protein
MPSLAAIDLAKCASTLSFVVEHIQGVERFVDAPELRDGLRQPHRAISDLQRAHEVGGRQTAQLERSGQLKHIVPMRGYAP